MRISILALEGTFDSGLSTVLDALAMANTLAQWEGVPTPGFEVTVVGVWPEVHTALGLRVPVCEIADAPTPDWVIVPALASIVPEKLLPAVICPTGKTAMRFSAKSKKSSPSRKNFSVSPSGKTLLEIRASRAPIERGVSRSSTTRWARDAMDVNSVRRG